MHSFKRLSEILKQELENKGSYVKENGFLFDFCQVS